MGQYKDKTIRNLVDEINDIYFLPDIQREFVWLKNKNEFEDKIYNLFDSILREYPIGTLLFWNVTSERIKEDKLTILKFIEKSNNDNEQLIDVPQKLTLVLDGQQRMTILYLALKGLFIDEYYKKERKRELFFNLLSNVKNENELTERLFEFKLFEVNKENCFVEENKRSKKIWFNIKNIIKEKIDPFNKPLEIKNDFNLNDEEYKLVGSNLHKLNDVINNSNNQIISFYEIEKNKTDEEALEIFVRVNSGGVKLTYSDLLFSKIKQLWKEGNENINARDEFKAFVDEINNNGKESFSFDNDFILKTSLVVIDKEIRYKLKNFDKTNINLIKINWEKIKQSIKAVVLFLTKIGITSSKFLRSNNAIIPMIYYVYKKNLKNIEFVSKDAELMKKYIYVILLNNVFGGQSDELLNDSREIIRNNASDFPLKEIVAKLGSKKTILKNDDVKDLLNEIKYNTDKSKIILSILFEKEMDSDYQEDHIYPRTKTEKLHNSEDVDNISNIQILKEINQKKGKKDFDEWLKEKFSTIEELDDYRNKFFIPKLINENGLSFEQIVKSYKDENEVFEKFISKRKDLISNKIKDYISV